MAPTTRREGEGTRTLADDAGMSTVDAARALAALRARGVTGDAVRHLEVHGSMPSTNATALEDARTGLVVVALEQTGGRGRSGARWASPRGGLYLSLAPPAALLPARPTDATLLAGLAVADAVDAALGVEAPRHGSLLKWPNDVLLGGAKVAGVLVQGRGPAANGCRDARTVIGIGLNVNSRVDLTGWAPHEGVEAPAVAGCVADALGRALALEPLLVDVVWRLVGRLGSGLTPPAVEEYRRRCATLGSRVAFTEGGSRVEASAVDVDDDGALVIEVEGVRRRVTAGEVRHVRVRDAA